MRIKILRKLTVLVAGFTLLVSVSGAQDIIVPPSYVFFKGDSLTGFDWKGNFDIATAKNLKGREVKAYMYAAEKKFVINKYNMITPPVPMIVTRGGSIDAGSSCNNADFEDGNFTNWTGNVGENNNSNAALTITAPGISTLGVNSAETSCSFHTLVTTGTDPYGGFPMLDPGGGLYACRLGGEDANLDGTCSTSSNDPTFVSLGETIQQSYPVTATNSMFSYSYAVVLEDGGHAAGEQPYFRTEVLDASGNDIPCLNYYEEATNGVPPAGFLTSPSNSTVFYLPWTISTLDLTAYIGTTVTIRFTAAGCIYGGHFGYAYIDCSCGREQLVIGGNCAASTVTAPAGYATYTWSGPDVTAGGSTQTATVGASGSYTVTMTTATGCTVTLDTNLTLSSTMTVTATQAPTNCTANNGTASVTSVTGGTGPYTYAWSNGATTSNISSLAAGTYTVVVSSVGGCSKTVTVTVPTNTVTPTPTFSQVNVPCNGGTGGSGTITTVTGGTSPYTYAWSNGSTTSNITPLAAGTYTVTVKDANGCTGTGSITITQPTAITTASTTTPTSCTGSIGTAGLTSVTGGTSPYTYSWSTGATTSTISNLAAGSYTVTVTDVHGCTKPTVITVTTTGATITPTMTSTAVLCNGGATGTASITGVTGTGTAPYTYTWNGGQTTTNITALSVGTYTITVKDANGCTGTGTVTVTQPATIATTSSSTPTTCSGTTGTASLATVAGGTSPYTYSWSTGATTSSINNLAAGSYTITVKDANGCTFPTIVNVGTTGATVTPTMTSAAVLCNGGATGTASVIGVTGTGTAPYTYSWSNGQTTTNATGLAAGTYTVTIKDANGCTGTGTVTVTQPNPVVVSTSSTPTTCTGSTGTASVSSVTGGTSPYTYVWSSGGTSTTANNLAAGTYTVTVTDANGCTGPGTVTVSTNSPPITPVLTSTPALCNGGSTGTASVTSVTGGTSPYTYAWSGGQTTTNVTTLPAGTYTLTTTDANGCSGSASITITQPTALAPSTTNTAALCNGGNGSATSSATGGTAGYTYSWSNGNTGTSISAIAGTYTVTVTDANGCTTTSTATITQPAAMVPTTATVPAVCSTNNGGASVTNVTGGTAAYTYAWSTGASTSSIANIGAGSYTVTITDANGCKQPVTIVVPNTGGPSDSIVSTTNILCYGGTNGVINLGVAGGTAPYTFSWSNGAVTQNLTGIGAGIYTVIIKDANGCIATATDTVKQPPQLRDSIITVTNVLCFGATTGSITAGVKGGTTAYTYSWSNGAGTLNNTNIGAGSYTLTITDANGCTVTANATITQPTQLTLKVAGFPASCNGECNGQLVAIPNGGTTPYTYSWSNASTGPSQLNVCAGTYSITVTDANGCTVDSVGIIITQPTPITLVTSTTTSHCSQADGGACVTAGGGTPGYTYAWAAGASISCLSNVVPGNYCVIVTDANKCADTICATVPNAPGDTATITATTPVSCNGGSDGTATAQGSGGTSPYTYSWSNGQVVSNATGLPAGPCTVTVTDATGCSNTAVAIITEPTPVVVTPPGPQTICINQSATLTVSAVGGNGGYTYTWTPGGMTGATVTVTPTVTTTYTINTTDSKLCPGNIVTVVVTVYPPLNIVVSPNQSICPGGTATISATGGGGDGTYNYNWMPGGMVGASQNVSPAATTVYTVTLTDGCTTTPVTDSVKVTVDPLPVVNFKADTLDGCTPLCINFSDLTTVAGGSVSSWAWSFGTGATSTSQNPTYCYNNAGTYTVGLTVTTNSGCVDSLTMNNMITAYSHPVAAFTESPQPATIVDPTISFTNQSTDNYGIATNFWQFGDPADGTSLLKDPQYTYSDTGDYCVKLTVTNIHGCTDSVTHCLVIEPYFTIYIPNAFSPNGDGLNDIFVPKGNYICTFEMYIFDRWGMQLYYTSDINLGWDGTVNGGSAIAQEDTYVYIINVTDCVEHKKHQYLGRVSIVK